jgi:hypothetical protein
MTLSSLPGTSCRPAPDELRRASGTCGSASGEFLTWDERAGGDDGLVESRRKIDDATSIVIPSDEPERGIAPAPRPREPPDSLISNALAPFSISSLRELWTFRIAHAESRTNTSETSHCKIEDLNCPGMNTYTKWGGGGTPSSSTH